jgi:hypothetical protein
MDRTETGREGTAAFFGGRNELLVVYSKLMMTFVYDLELLGYGKYIYILLTYLVWRYGLMHV